MHRHATSEHGFTLVEVMVALAVFSLAALALIRLEGATLRATGTVGRATLAQVVARNVAIDAVSDARPATGASEGVEVNGGQRWLWTRQVTPTGNAAILRVDVAVRAPSGPVLARLTMIRPPGQSPAP